MKNSSYYIAPVGDRTHDLPHTVASNMVKVSHKMAADKETIGLSRVHMYESKCILPLRNDAGFTGGLRHADELATCTSIISYGSLRGATKKRPKRNRAEDRSRLLVCFVDDKEAAPAYGGPGMQLLVLFY